MVRLYYLNKYYSNYKKETKYTPSAIWPEWYLKELYEIEEYTNSENVFKEYKKGCYFQILSFTILNLIYILYKFNKIDILRALLAQCFVVSYTDSQQNYLRLFYMSNWYKY